MMTGIFRSVASFASITVFARKFGDADVLYGLEQTCLMIEQQDHSVGFVSSSACPPPVGSTLEGAPPAIWANALGICATTPIARKAARQRSALFNTVKVALSVMIISTPLKSLLSVRTSGRPPRQRDRVGRRADLEYRVLGDAKALGQADDRIERRRVAGGVRLDRRNGDRAELPALRSCSGHEGP